MSLLCRSQQLAKNGKANFNTSENKLDSTEMNNVSFSNEPNRGYTREGQGANMTNPQNVWIVTDLGYLIMDRHDRFCYTDGWQVIGKNDQVGFSLDFNSEPVVFLMTNEAFSIVCERVQKDPRFVGKSNATVEWLSKHVVIISENEINTSLTYPEQPEFTLSATRKQQLTEKLLLRHRKDKAQKSRLIPSGQLVDNQIGDKIMTYLWEQR